VSEWNPAEEVFSRCTSCRWPAVCAKDKLCWEQERDREEAAVDSKAAQRRAQLRELAGLPVVQGSWS
jgi:hypothetical protein